MKIKLPRIRSILILINLFILVLPLASIGLLRLYESTLIRKTESSLIAQSAFISAIYRARIKINEAAFGILPKIYGQEIANNYARQISSAISNRTQSSRRSTTRQRTVRDAEPYQRWKPRYAVLDLSTNKILPRPPDPIRSLNEALAIEITSGAATSAIMREAQVHTLSGMRLVNAKGIIIASTADDSGKSILNWLEVSQALKGLHISSLRKRHSDSPQPSLTSISRGTGIRVFVATPIVYKRRVIAALILSRTPATLSQSLYNNQSMLIFMMLGLVTIVTILSVITSHVIAKPVQAVAEQAKQVADGKIDNIETLASPRTIEVQELSNAVVKMSRALEKRANYIQDFAAQVSHAFKTPLTAIQGAIELLKEHFETMTADERSRFLANLDSDSKYLESLVNRLLDLARADTKTNLEGPSNICEILKVVSERASDKNIAIELTLPEHDYFAAIDSSVFESIIQNLIDNSVQHGKPPITIHAQKITLGSHSRCLQIVVQDNGPGISSANVASIFTPFFTTARATGGTGLGLAVVKTLLENYNSSIEFQKTNIGACFIIKLQLIK